MPDAYVVEVPKYIERQDNPLPGIYDGAAGEYVVKFILCRAGFPLIPEGDNTPGERLVGDSHLEIGALNNLKVTAVVGDQGSGCARETLEFVGKPNPAGFLASFETKCEAKSFRDARRKAHDALAPVLSAWSLVLDIPLSIFRVALRELKSGIPREIFNRPYPKASLAVPYRVWSDAEIRGCAGVYREAVNGSNTPAYRFLCFFKLLESIRLRRERLAQQSKIAAKPFIPNKAHEVLPDSEQDLVVWLRAILLEAPSISNRSAINSVLVPEAKGRRFGFIIDNHLRPLRDRIAHLLFDEHELEIESSSDSQVTAEDVYKWLPLMKCMVRRMLKNEFPAEFLNQLPEPP